MSDLRLDYPATHRNRAPILAVLAGRIAPGLVLEVACGSGQHAAHFAAALPHVTWQPTDPDPECVASADAWCAGVPNVLPALRMDVHDPEWPVSAAQTVYCANMVHIAPWSAALALLAGAGRVLVRGGRLVLYGPFRVPGEPFAESNAAFDARLRERNPTHGVRDLGEIALVAASHGLRVEERVPMPANNLTVVFSRDASR